MVFIISILPNHLVYLFLHFLNVCLKFFFPNKVTHFQQPVKCWEFILQKYFTLLKKKTLLATFLAIQGRVIKCREDEQWSVFITSGLSAVRLWIPSCTVKLFLWNSFVLPLVWFTWLALGIISDFEYYITAFLYGKQ